ncbi:hypothetical protein [Halobellus ruber]|uniref:DUF7984 domain-containing protein n=1 Tax=Halobellus ruber TaxID=2761102 RepID=A0A7J9SHZ6_9EURY|nr:hypothetical protein [Halobellus ruber]MBB6645597.1 hypothetical protein [Halobellus ruber]
MDFTPERVRSEARWVADRADVVVPLINDTRDRLGEAFDTTVDPVEPGAYREAVATTFADGDVAVNVAAYVGLLRDLDVDGDYPGFVVDEVLGRELAAAIAGGTPLSLLAQATFHYADVTTHPPEEGANGSGGDAEAGAGIDDLDAALAAGFQTRLPGWAWRETESPFEVDPADIVE